MSDVWVHVKEISNGSNHFASKGIGFNWNMMVSKPLHDCMHFQHGLLDIGDSLAAEDMAAYCDEILMHQSFGLVMHVKVLLEFGFFGWKGVVGRIICPDQRERGR